MRFSRNAWQRGSSALAVCAFLGAQLGAVLHEATVDHVRCAEHGELMDAETATGAAAPAHAAIQSQAAPAGEHSGHEHCSIVAMQRAPSVLSTPSLLLSRAVAITEPQRTGLIAAKTLDPEFSAPKTSPPSAHL